MFFQEKPHQIDFLYLLSEGEHQLYSRYFYIFQKFNDLGDVTTVLIDTSPDLRNQLLKTNVKQIDAVLYTHDHADQSGGIDDLRIFALRKRKRVKVYIDDKTASRLIPRFSYCFNTLEDKVYPAILEKNTIIPFEDFVINGPGGDIKFLPFLQKHGKIDSLGFKFNNIAYSSDVVDFYPESFDLLNNLENISNTRHEQRKLEEMADDEEDDGPIKIMDDINLNIDVLDINTL